MYYFVEFLRAKRALFIALILLGLVFLAAVILRVSVHTGHWDADLQSSPTAHVTKTQLGDGSTRIVVDDAARQTHAVIVRHPDGAFDMDVIEPKNGSNASHHHMDFVTGSTNMSTRDEGNTTHTVIHYRHDMPNYDLGILFMATIPMGLIVASILGGLLAKENDGHLELAWTKPVSRERYALAGMTVDALAIAVAQLLTIAVTLAASLMFFVPRFSYGATAGWEIVLAFAAPIAWYALITAASASLRRGPGMVIGLGWVLAILIPSIGGALQNAAQMNAIAAWFYAIFRGLSYIDPIAYLAMHNNHPTLMSFPASAGVLCALVAGYVALAVAQWRRVEA